MTDSNIKRVYFVRHGESETNKDRIHRGAGAILTEGGMRQAEAVAERFLSVPIEIIVTSTFPRAISTADIIKEKIKKPTVVSELFVERTRAPELQGLSHDSTEWHYINKMIRDHFHDINYRYSDEENFQDLKIRAEKSTKYLEELKEENILVVTHGTYIRFLIAHMCFGDALTPDIFLKFHKFFRTWNTGITYLDFINGEWRLHQWNDSAHLG